MKNATEVVKSEKKFDASKERTQKDEVTDIRSALGAHAAILKTL